MQIIKTITETKSIIKTVKAQGKSIGFVPTMGFLHRGHLTLIEKARSENDFVVVSIFVNPTQFGVGEDFETYPRSLERDAALCEQGGADLIFHPEASEIYPNGYKTYVEVFGITDYLCGASRPGHFKGVTTVVNKLFNITQPDKAYFGQKDAQQVAVIQQMVRDLDMNVAIVPCPIARESDGLAMSSRNTYLSTEERQAALVLSKSLFDVKKRIEQGERDSALLREWMINHIKSEPRASIDYVEIVNAATLEPVCQLQGEVLIALAVKIGKVRLIDNIRLIVR